MTVFEGILADPMTNKRLTELLKKAAEADTAPPAEAPSPFQSIYTAGETLTNRPLDGKVRFDLTELENLHLYFLSVIEVIEKAKAGGGTAKQSEPPPGKKYILFLRIWRRIDRGNVTIDGYEEAKVGLNIYRKK